jgi:hypothetical protein
MFLQLHDGPGLPYGYKKLPYPVRTGELMPLRYSEDPFYPGSPVLTDNSYQLLSGCDQAQVYADFVKQDKDGWKLRLGQIDQAKKLFKDFQTLKQAYGTGSVPLYNEAGEITGFRQGSKLEQAIAYFDFGVKIGRALRGQIDAAAARRLKDDAQLLYDQNKWGIANVCQQTLPMLVANAQLCYDSMQYWIGYYSDETKKKGETRIAARAVVLRQSALVILIKEIESKGGSFTPGGSSGTKTPLTGAAILAILTGLAFLRF